MTASSSVEVVCEPGSTQPCYDGPPGTLGVGPCAAGLKTCLPDGSGFGACMDQVLPLPETCNTPLDDDCNGFANDQGVGCVCAPGSLTPCYTGPVGTQGVGACKGGLKACEADGTAFGPCSNEVVPVPETCLTPVDDDCNGVANDQGDSCVCAPAQFGPCYTGPAGTQGVGVCKAGMALCSADGTSMAACMGQQLPGQEDCLLPTDEDCDGTAQACTGTPQWGLQYGDASTQTAAGVVVSAQGVTVAGTFNGSMSIGGNTLTSAGSTDVFVAMVDLAGVPVWARRFGDSAAQSVSGVAVNPQGSEVVVVGQFAGQFDVGLGPLVSAGATDVFVVAMRSDGTPHWARRYGDNVAQSATAVAVAPDGSVAVVGSFSGTINLGGGNLISAGSLDMFVAVLDQNGSHQWSRRFGDTQAQGATAVAFDPIDGGLVVAATIAGSVDFGSGTLGSAGSTDAVLARFDTTGTTVWAKRFGDASAQEAKAVAVQQDGTVVLALAFNGTLNPGVGQSLVSAGGSDMALVAVNLGGAPVWARGFGGVGTDTPRALTVDPFGSVVLVGDFTGAADFGTGLHTSAGSSDVVVLKVDHAGGPLWAQTAGDAAAQVGAGVASDRAAIYVVGAFSGAMDLGSGTLTSAGGDDVFLARLAH